MRLMNSGVRRLRFQHRNASKHNKRHDSPNIRRNCVLSHALSINHNIHTARHNHIDIITDIESASNVCKFVRVCV